jgi:SAM-dependent methyltransferase
MSDLPPPTAGSGDEARLAALVTDLAASAEALCAIAGALALRASGDRAASAVEVTLVEVLAVLGLTDLVSRLDRPEQGALASVLRARIAAAHDLAFEPARRPGAPPLVRGVMESQGLSSETLAVALRATVLSRLAGLEDRLEAPRSRFLDVGAGAGGLAIGLCRLWPALSAVGIDTSQAALAFARARVAEAGLSGRIELRVQDVAQLEDDDAFDLVWLPASFIAEAVLPVALRRARRATRVGGWIVLNVLGGASELKVALARLRTARIGGTLLRPDEAEAALAAAGWKEVHSLPPGTLPSLWMTVGRRPQRKPGPP